MINKGDNMNNKEILDNDKLVKAFVQGAKFWEYHVTGGTMWSSDQHICEMEADRRLRNGTLGKD